MECCSWDVKLEDALEYDSATLHSAIIKILLPLRQYSEETCTKRRFYRVLPISGLGNLQAPRHLVRDIRQRITGGNEAFASSRGDGTNLDGNM